MGGDRCQPTLLAVPLADGFPFRSMDPLQTPMLPVATDNCQPGKSLLISAVCRRDTRPFHVQNHLLFFKQKLMLAPILISGICPSRGRWTLRAGSNGWTSLNQAEQGVFPVRRTFRKDQSGCHSPTYQILDPGAPRRVYISR